MPLQSDLTEEATKFTDPLRIRAHWPFDAMKLCDSHVRSTRTSEEDLSPEARIELLEATVGLRRTWRLSDLHQKRK